ncbi:MAG: hypothetical protein GY763_12830 [Gammaproteobacteria bacterium]|nr:hypothetical protein [Gammaproteobacteria bacterium]
MGSSASTIRPTQLPDLELFWPTHIDELIEHIKGGAKLLAGGTDLLLQARNQGQPQKLAWIGNIESMHNFAEQDEQWQVGAGISLGKLISNAAFRRAAPAIVDAAQLVGSVQIRNQATLLGNICSASPAGDTLPALLVHEAEVETAKSHSLLLDDFLIAPGQTALAPGDILLSVSLRGLRANEISCYYRHTERKALDLAVASVAIRLSFEDDGCTIAAARIALGAVGPTAMLAKQAAESLVGQPLTKKSIANCATIAAEICNPISDFRASADYRRLLIRVLVGDVINQIEKRVQLLP